MKKYHHLAGPLLYRAANQKWPSRRELCPAACYTGAERVFACSDESALHQGAKVLYQSGAKS